jgi:hypothetical protein
LTANVSLPTGASTEPLHAPALQLMIVVLFPGVTVTAADWVEADTYAGLRFCAAVARGIAIRNVAETD